MAPASKENQAIACAKYYARPEINEKIRERRRQRYHADPQADMARTNNRRLRLRTEALTAEKNQVEVVVVVDSVHSS